MTRWTFNSSNVILSAFLAADAAVSLTRDGLGAAPWFAGSLVLVVCALRRPPATASNTRPVAFALVAASYGLPLCVEVEGIPSGPRLAVCIALQLLAFLLWVSAVLTLRNRFALMPALREPVSSGPYRLIRHPMYLAYLLMMGVAVLWTPSVRNVTLFVAAGALFAARAALEEATLSQDAAYQAYTRRVRYRLLPAVF